MSNRPPQQTTVLVVDDHDAVRQAIVRGLREVGYSVIEVSDGALALGVLASGRRVDVLLTDIIMPNMGGLELANLVKGMRHPPTLLFMSAYNFEPSMLPGRLFHKPVRPTELVAEVRRLIAAA